MSRKQKLIIDCDTGSDDAVALMTAVLSDRFDILAVTTTHGNLPVKYTTENTLRVLELLGRQDIPVYPCLLYTSHPLVRRYVVNALPLKKHVPFIRRNKTTYHAKCGGFPASARPQKGDKLVVCLLYTSRCV